MHQRSGLGEQLGKVKARGLQFGLVERIWVASRDLTQGHLRHAGPEVSKHHVAGHSQVVHRCSAHLVGVLHAFHADFHRELGHLLAQARHGSDEFFHAGVVRFFFGQLTNQLAKLAQRGALVAQNLAAQQVQRLDGVGALVNHVDAGVAHKLLHAPLFDKAVAAKHLQAARSGGPAVVGDERLDDGCEHGEHFTGFLAYFFVRVAVLLL